MHENCYCGRRESYADCCGAIHKGTKKAATAEDLMRSRYSAFVCADIDYILATYSNKTRPLEQKEEILLWAKSVKWIGLEVVSTKNGSEGDKEAWVEFKASFIEEGNSQVMHEKSYFIIENNSWVYVSGEYPKPDQVKSLPNRNDLCFCGSGKKFKKCCFNK